jgi:2-oxo-3-hexenedioate decarboxylase
VTQALRDPEVRALAEWLDAAERERREVVRLSEEHPHLSVADGYAIQRALIRLRGERGDPVVGVKAGLTSRAKQEAMGVHEPIYGYLSERMILDEDEELAVSELIHPRAEPEIAFLLGAELRGPGVTLPDVLAATRGIAPAIEIIDSRYRDFKFTLADVVADNASSARVITGTWMDPSGLDLRMMGMIFEKNGEIVETGAGAAVLGHPAVAVAWLANALADSGESLRPGQIVMPGALANAHAVAAGDEVRASFDHLGSVVLRCR